MFSSRNKLTPVAIDLGSHELKMLQLAPEGDSCRVVAATRRVLPSDLRRAEERRAALSDAISESWKEGGFKGREVYCVVPEPMMHFKSFRLPQMPNEELHEVARFEAEERFALEDPEAEYRFIYAGEVRQGQDTRQEVIAMACAGDVLTQSLEMFDSLRLTCRAMDVAPCCVVRAMEWRTSTAEAGLQVYADIGYHSTRLIVTRARQVLFIKSIDVGGERLNELVTRNLKLEPAEAADMRRRLAVPDDREQGESERLEIYDSVYESIKPALEQLSKEIGLCMRYYAVTFRGSRPEAMTCLGGESHDVMLLEALSAASGMKLTKGAPFKRIETSRVFSGADRHTQLPEWATVVGLALRAVHSTPQEVTS